MLFESVRNDKMCLDDERFYIEAGYVHIERGKNDLFSICD